MQKCAKMVKVLKNYRKLALIFGRFFCPIFFRSTPGTDWGTESHNT